MAPVLVVPAVPTVTFPGGTTRGVTLTADQRASVDVTFEGAARDPWGGSRIGFEASAEIDREDFGLTWNQTLETGGVLVGHEIKIHLEAQAVKG